MTAPLKVLIGCETSGIARRAFTALGHDARSIDLLPSEDNGDGHFIGDLFEVLAGFSNSGWWPELAIFHPTCTYLTNSAAWAFGDPDFLRYPGVGYHQSVKPGTLVGQPRREARQAALQDVKRIMSLPIKRKAIENPIGAISKAIRRPDQIVQPYDFGDDASKATCLWLYGLLPLRPTCRIQGRMVHRQLAMGKSDRAAGCSGPDFIERWSNQTDTGQNRISPSEDRWKARSKTFPGIAQAMAAQWGGYALEQAA